MMSEKPWEILWRGKLLGGRRMSESDSHARAGFEAFLKSCVILGVQFSAEEIS